MSDSHPPASKGTILVADDDPDIVAIAKTTLEGTGYGVQTAYNGFEVFSRLEEQKPDLIILDVMMSKMSGLKVLTRLRGTAETSSIPVIQLTAKFQQKDALRAYKLEGDFCIPKPFTITHLINVVNFILNKDKNTQTKPISSLRLA